MLSGLHMTGKGHVHLTLMRQEGLGHTFLQAWTALLFASKIHGVPFHMRMLTR